MDQRIDEFATDAQGEAGDCCFIVRSNCCMSAGAWWALFGVVTAVCLVVGAGFALAGAWLVLPFAGLEILVVGAVLWTVLRHANDHERIEVRSQRLRITSCVGAQETTSEFQSYWARVALERRGGWYPARLVVRSHGRAVEVGARLNEEARHQLAEDLGKVIGSAYS